MYRRSLMSNPPSRYRCLLQPPLSVLLRDTSQDTRPDAAVLETFGRYRRKSRELDIRLQGSWDSRIERKGFCLRGLFERKSERAGRCEIGKGRIECNRHFKV